jgi:hypothetical protein
MGEFAAAIGAGISGLVGNSIATIGSVLAGMVNQLVTVVPGGAPIVAAGAILLVLLLVKLIRG